MVKAMKDNFVWNNGIIIRVSGVRVPPPPPFFFKQNRQFLAITPCLKFCVDSHKYARSVNLCVTGVRQR